MNTYSYVTHYTVNVYHEHSAKNQNDIQVPQGYFLLTAPLNIINSYLSGLSTIQ